MFVLWDNVFIQIAFTISTPEEQKKKIIRFPNDQ